MILASRAEVARLYGRALFGATAVDLDRGTTMTYEQLVASLFPPAPADVRPAAPDDADRVLLSGASSPSWLEMYGSITWWTERMRTGAWPLEERLTFFWHDHFATAFASPPNTDVLTIQNQTLRIHSLGDFRALCNAITVDAAMLIWLNGTDSVAWAVNENYAREFFELFTLGAPPPGAGTQCYTEDEIKAVAKALTGWRFVYPREVAFDNTKHVHGVPLALDGIQVCSGVWNDGTHATDYQRVTQVALGPARADGAARYLAGELVRSFGYVPEPAAPFTPGADPLVERVATALKPANPADPTARWDVAKAVRALLLAPEWRGAQPAERQGARSPVETLVHAARILNVDLYRYTTSNPTPTNPYPVRTYERKFVDAAAQAGQMLFYPPGVGGWPAGAEWFSTMNNISRYDILHRLHADWATQSVAARPALPASGDLAAWTAFMGLAALSANTVARIQAYLADPSSGDEAAKQRGVFLLIGTSPDWQVM